MLARNAVVTGRDDAPTGGTMGMTASNDKTDMDKAETELSMSGPGR